MTKSLVIKTLQNETPIMFHPLFFMVLLTLGAACIAIKNRFFSVKNESTSHKCFQLIQGEIYP
jgi:hypothetical protein